VVPAVALRHPHDLSAVREIEAVFLAAVAEEGLGLLLDDGPGRAGRGVDLDDPVDLVAALVIFEGESAAVLAPGEVGELIGVGEERVVDLDSRPSSTRKRTGRSMSKASPGLAYSIVWYFGWSWSAGDDSTYWMTRW